MDNKIIYFVFLLFVYITGCLSGKVGLNSCNKNKAITIPHVIFNSNKFGLLILLVYSILSVINNLEEDKELKNSVAIGTDVLVSIILASFFFISSKTEPLHRILTTLLFISIQATLMLKSQDTIATNTIFGLLILSFVLYIFNIKYVYDILGFVQLAYLILFGFAFS